MMNILYLIWLGLAVISYFYLKDGDSIIGKILSVIYLIFFARTVLNAFDIYL